MSVCGGIKGRVCLAIGMVAIVTLTTDICWKRTVALTLSFGQCSDFEVCDEARHPFKRHRFPQEIILLAVRWYCRYPLSYQDVVDLLAERGVAVDRSTIFRWVQKFGPEIAKRAERHLRRSSLDWHVDETYIRVGGKWRYLWRAVDTNGQLIDFRLTERRDARAEKPFCARRLNVSDCTAPSRSSLTKHRPITK